MLDPFFLRKTMTANRNSFEKERTHTTNHLFFSRSKTRSVQMRVSGVEFHVVSFVCQTNVLEESASSTSFPCSPGARLDYCCRSTYSPAIVPIIAGSCADDTEGSAMLCNLSPTPRLVQAFTFTRPWFGVPHVLSPSTSRSYILSTIEDDGDLLKQEKPRVYGENILDVS